MSHKVLVRGLFVKLELCVCNSGITWVLFLVCQRVVTVLYLTVSIHFVYALLYLAGLWLGVVIVHLVLAHVLGLTDSPACLSVVRGKIFVFKSCNFSPALSPPLLHRCWTVDLSLVGVMEFCSNAKLTCLIVKMGRKDYSEIKITVMWLGMVSLGEKFFKTHRFFDTWTEPIFADPWSCGTTFILIFLYVYVCVCIHTNTQSLVHVACTIIHCAESLMWHRAAQWLLHCQFAVVWVHMFECNVLQLILGFYSPYLMKELAVVSFSSGVCHITLPYVTTCFFCERYWQLCQHAYAGLSVFT